MSWLFISLLAYFFYAIVTVIDKTIVKKDVKHPLVYIFYIAAFGGILIALALIILQFLPFKFDIPDPATIFVALVAGTVFIWALYLMFVALKKGEATRVSSMIGSLTPIFILILAWYILGENLTCNQYLAFTFLIAGVFLISLDFQKHGLLSWLKKKLGFETKLTLPQIRKTLWLSLPTAFLFAISLTLTKFVYLNTDFISGLIWIKTGSLLTIIILLFVPKNFQLLLTDLKQKKKSRQKTQKLSFKFALGQISGGLGELSKQYAISLGSVTLVNALQGFQYALIFIIVIITTSFFPKFLREEMSREIFFQKALAVLIIFAGLYFLAL